MKVNVLFLYFIQVMIYTLLLFLFRELIINKDVFQLSFGEQMDDSMIARAYKMQEEYAYLQYLMVPVSLLFKVSATATCIYVRCFFANIKVQFSFLFRNLPNIIKSLWKKVFNLILIFSFLPHSIARLISSQ